VIGGLRNERVKSHVYVAALAPDEGQTGADVFYREEPHAEAPKLSPDIHGYIWMPEDGFGRAVAHNASSEQTRILAAVQRPISVRCIQEKAPMPGWKVKPSWFLLAEEDRMISPKTQQFMAGRMNAKVRSNAVDHSPMYTAPALVVEVILEAAQESVFR
jgi:pimeloyl-ACP methyl ester carboxylesterase